jgi:hypothetical protein
MGRLWHYVYYSYEEWGRGYIGKRSSQVPPGLDPYMGSFSDATFNPTNKIILGEFSSEQDALAAEILLHHFYAVDVNFHFANKAKQTSSKFYYKHTSDPHANLSSEQIAARNSKRGRSRSAGARGFYYCLTSPTGLIVVTHNLRATCRDRGLNRGNLNRVLKGERNHCNGWTITKHHLP